MTLRIVKSLVALSGVCTLGSAIAQTTAPADTPAYTLSGNLGAVSDYRFRGISQSYRLPAVQAGLDYTHTSGLYLGNWNSSVSGNSYNNGASLESDLYGGYRFEPVKDLGADVGVLFYLYPGAKLNAAPGVPSDHRYDNAELYVGLTRGPFNAKVSYALTDYFGLNGETAGYAYFSALPDRGSSKGRVARIRSGSAPQHSSCRWARRSDDPTVAAARGPSNSHGAPMRPLEATGHDLILGASPSRTASHS
jgi:uncharacterized protein (TIGR02001 family)